MKRILSSIAAALVAVSFAGLVCAAEAPKKEAVPAPAAPAAGEVKKEEKKPVKKKKATKAKKAAKKEETVKPAESPAAPDKK